MPPLIQEMPSISTHSAAPVMSSPNLLRGELIAGGSDALPPETGNSFVTFRIQSILGEGGMGVVYRAVQEYPSRTVALKVLKGALAQPDLIRRFEREVGILAALTHPGIAQLFSAGTMQDPSGVRVPFLAMEYVPGLPIHKYARKTRLKVRARIELFLKVCEAVIYVHTSGIVHRDLTVNNILVDDEGRPKILDFGLANFVHQNRQHNSLLTLTGQPLGTLQYMSPEQATGRVEHIDNQADVYALGVVLFKLLTGRHPYNLHQLNVIEALQRIKDVAPPRLSSKNKNLRGDLETIVEKALHKEKRFRYATVADLAADLRRYLAHEPILARRASPVYATSKFIRRHRVLVGSVVLIIMALAVGLVIAAREAMRANAEARRAGIQLAEAKVAQGDALLLGEQYTEARDAYDTAWDEFDRQKESSLPAQLGIWELDQSSARPIRVLVADAREVSRVAIASNQLLFAIGWDDGRVEVRDVLTNAIRLKFSCEGFINKLLFAPSGQYLGVCCQDQLRIWNVRTGKIVRSVQFADNKLIGLAMSEKTLALFTQDGVISVAALGDNDPLRPVLFPGRHPAVISLDENDSLVVVDTQGQVWKQSSDIAELKSLGRISSNRVIESAISTTGKYVAVLDEKNATIFSLPDLSEVSRVPALGGQIVVGFSNDQTFYLGGNKLQRYDVYGFDQHVQSTIQCRRMQFAALSGSIAIAERSDNSLVLWAVGDKPGSTTIALPGLQIVAAELSPDGQLAAFGGDDGSVRLFDAIGGHFLASFETGRAVKVLKFDGSGTMLAIGATSGGIQFWSLANLEKVGQIIDDKPLRTFAFSRSGQLAVSSNWGENGAKLWHVSNGRWQPELVPASREVYGLNLSADSKRAILSVDADGVELWSLSPTIKKLRTLLDSATTLNANFAQAETRIVGTSADGTLQVWDASADYALRTLQTSARRPWRIAASDGPEVALLSGTRVELFDVNNYRLLRRFPPLASTAYTIALSGDGFHLLVAGRINQLLDLGLPAVLHHGLDDISANTGIATSARCFAAVGVMAPALQVYHRLDSSISHKPQLQDAYVYWSMGDKQNARKIFASATMLSETTRSLLIRVLDEASQP